MVVQGAYQAVSDEMKFHHAMKELSLLKEKQVPLTQVCDRLEKFLRDEDPEEYKPCWDTLSKSLQWHHDRAPEQYDLAALRFFAFVVIMDCKKPRINTYIERNLYVRYDSEIRIIEKLSQKNYVFMETDSGLFAMKDYLTLMLFDKSFLVSLPKKADQELSVHEIFNSRSSVIFVHDIMSHHPGQEAMQEGYFSEFYDIAMKHFRVLWNNALGWEHTNPEKYTPVLHLLFWMLHEQFSMLISEYMGEFKADPMKKLGLSIPDMYYVDPGIVKLLTGETISFEEKDSSVELSLKALKVLQGYQKLPHVKGTFDAIRQEILEHFEAKYPAGVEKLDCVGYPLQQKKINLFLNTSQVLRTMEQECVRSGYLGDITTTMVRSAFAEERIPAHIDQAMLLFYARVIEKKECLPLTYLHTYVSCVNGAPSDVRWSYCSKKYDFESQVVALFNGVHLAILPLPEEITYDSLSDSILCNRIRAERFQSSMWENRIELYKPIVEEALASSEGSTFRKSAFKYLYLYFEEAMTHANQESLYPETNSLELSQMIAEDEYFNFLTYDPASAVVYKAQLAPKIFEATMKDSWNLSDVTFPLDLAGKKV